jgi:hypothetical protein
VPSVRRPSLASRGDSMTVLSRAERRAWLRFMVKEDERAQSKHAKWSKAVRRGWVTRRRGDHGRVGSERPSDASQTAQLSDRCGVV